MMLEEKFILNIVNLENLTAEKFFAFQRQFCKQHKCQFPHKDKLLIAYQKLLKSKRIEKNNQLESILQLKKIRSQSGIVVVSVLTKPFACHGKCLYCPTETGVPKSYLSREPAVMRAIANGYHPYKQIASRLKALQNTGHITDKVSIRIIGGTWSYYPQKYQSWFIREIYRAANEFESSQCSKFDLKSLQAINEMAKSRIVELSIETRPDYISIDELLRLRRFGVTKVELGVQSLYDEVLTRNNRGHGVVETILATELLKDFGFKVSYQMMLNLYGSNAKKDLEMFRDLFSDERYKPDHMKIYPLAVINNSPMQTIVLAGKHHIYNEAQLIKIIADIKKNIPVYCRIERIIRDIPSDKIHSGGAKVSNLRQAVTIEMSKRGIKCNCIRCRQVNPTEILPNIILSKYKYTASGNTEYFISAESNDNKSLVGFCRLRLISTTKYTPHSGIAIIREIHIYGNTVKIEEVSADDYQHKGWGKKMIAEAENLAKAEGFAKIAVISGVGVRKYFESLGYKLDGAYVVKKLDSDRLAS